MKLTVFSDGASRGNPGEAGCGFVILNENGDALFEGALYLGTATNNVAEYTAVLEAAKKALCYEPDSISFFLDSELIVKQMSGEYKVKNENLKEIRNRLIETLNGLSVSFSHVPREQNKVADKLANLAIDKKLNKS
jgi:ribonuclease HI